MTEHTASRTLVKSPPELWAECSDATALTRHLDRFGDIKITRLEPETAIAWEGEQVRGTVRLEPSGWGTKVTLTAVDEGAGAAVAVAAEPEAVAAEPVALDAVAPEPVAPVAIEFEPVAEAGAVVSVPPPGVVEAPPVEPASEKRPGLFSRLLAKLVGSPEPEPELVLQELTAESLVTPPEPEVEASPEPRASIEAELADAEAALVAALDSLGQAHHRPFSRG